MARPDRGTHASSAEQFTAGLAAVILAVGAGMLVLLTIRFAALAARSSYSAWHILGIPHKLGNQIALLVIALVVALLVLMAGLRRRDPLLRFENASGTVFVRAGAFEDSIRNRVAADADVISVSPHVRMQGGKVAAEVEMVARPLADKDRLRALAEAQARAALCECAGLPDVRTSVHLHVPSARKMWRYL